MPTPELSREELARRFAEIKPALSRDEARAQAARCLYCYDAPCTRACPTHIDVPRFIRQILHDNPMGAAETILDANALGGSCARVCPTEVLCEGACVDRTLQGAPVLIGQLQRYAVDQLDARGIALFDPGPTRAGKVAVVGAGPAGLSCAFELRRLGIAVTVFEARDLPGGLNALGIAPYKIDTDYALAEARRVAELGAEIRLDSPVDGQGLKRLREDYGAVFLGLGLGLGRTSALDIPGEAGDGVWDALDFIAQLHRREYEDCELGKSVLVIGGGNTAMDVASEASRLGAPEVIVLYRRRREDMPAYRHERELVESEGVRFEWLAAPLEFLREAGRLTGVRCQRLCPAAFGRGARLDPVPGSEFVIPCDMAIKAMGQLPRLDLIRSLQGLTFERGKIRVDPASNATSLAGVYAGGDCVNGGREVVHAVQDGKIAAYAIARYLSA